MNRRVYFYFALTFLLGVVVGGAGLYYYAWNTGHWHRPFNRQNFVQRLKTQLDLSESQVSQVERVIESTTAKFRSAQQQADTQLNAIREETRNGIRQILTPQQAQKFDELTRRWDERRRRTSH